MSASAVELVPFKGGAIEAVMHDGRPWCAVRSICLALDLDIKNQHVKLKAKPWATMVFITTVAADGKQREVLCIDLDSLPMWLATIEPSRVKAEARDALVSYQREAAQVLRDHFLGRSAAPELEATSTVDTRTPDPRTPEERRELLGALFAHPAMVRRSDRFLGRLVRLSPTTVGKLRQEFEDGQPAVRLTRDQRVVDTTNIGDRPTREDRLVIALDRMAEELRRLQAQAEETAALRGEMETIRKAVVSAQLRPALNRSEINEVATVVALRLAGRDEARASAPAGALVSTAEMAERLGMSARTFQRHYTTNPFLRRLAHDPNDSGRNLRWPAAEVAALLGLPLRPLMKGGNA